MAEPPAAALRPYVPRSLLAWDTLFEHPHGAIDGSAISVDIVGFTALSEALAGLGRRGAEELVGLVNDVFCRLIAIADHAGADILTFGGDAMTMLTRGDGHAMRAVAAAAAMREVLSEPVQAPSVGPVQLSMSTGISSGACWLFAIEGHHREFVVTGPMITRTLVAEGAASAGQILVTDATATLLPPGWLGQTVGGELELRHAQPTEGHLVTEPPAAEFVDGSAIAPVDPAAFVPPGQRQLLATGGLIGEHRLTTIGFIAVTGLDALIEQAGPADVQRRLQSLMGELATAMTHTGVHWLQTDTNQDGAKFLLAAGAPTSTGADERAMLACVQLVVDAGIEMDLRVGVNRGRTFTGSVGSPVGRRTYTAMGDATNLAARLMGMTTSGQVMTTRRVVDAAGAGVRATAVAPFRVKGKSQPIEGVLLTAVDREEDPAPHADRVLVGREAELATLTDLAAAVREHHGRAVTITGEAGIGKSTLLQGFLSDVVDLARSSVRVQRYDRARPYLAVRLLLQRALPDLFGAEAGRYVGDALGADGPLAPLLAPLLDIGLGTTPEAEAVDRSYRLARMGQLVLRLLAQRLAGPTVLVVEDLHWVDDASRELLSAISRGIDAAPALLVTTSRPSGVPLPDATTMTLGGLDLDAARALARQLDTDLPDRLLTRVLERAAGNPLFVCELLLSVTDDDAELPDSIEAVITARLDSLSPGDRLALCDASVLGEEIDPDTLSTIRGRPLDDGWTDRVADYVSRHPTRGLVFAHDLYRTAAYGALAYARRATLHRRAGEELERRGADDALLALHFHRGADATRAWRYGIRAGRSAMAANAAADAVPLFDAALSHVDALSLDPAEVADTMEACGDVCELSGLLVEATARFEAALDRRADDDAAAARLLRKAGLLDVRLGNLASGARRYEEGIRRAEAVDDPQVRAGLQAALEVGAAGIAYRQGRYADGERQALSACHDAITGADQRQLGHAFQLLDLCRQAQGRGLEYQGWAAPTFAAAGDLVGEGNALNNEGIADYYAGRWDSALERYRASLDARARAGDVLGQAMSANNIGEVLSDQGHLVEAKQMFEAAQRDWRAIGYTIGAAISTSNLARVSIRQGAVTGARAALEEALASFERIDAGQYVIETHGRLAEAALADGDPSAALAELDRIDQADDAGSQPAVDVWLQRLRAMALYALGQEAKADAIAEDARTAAGEGGMAYELMWLAALSRDQQNRDELARRLLVESVPPLRTTR